MIDFALSLLDKGLQPLPADPARKCPTLHQWKCWQSERTTPELISEWFAHADGLCLVAGTISGNLECIDFDCGGKLFEAWSSKIKGINQNLFDRLVIEKTPSGGYHVCYQFNGAEAGNLKLASETVEADSGNDLLLYGKSYKPRRGSNGKYSVTLTTIETRGTGGIFLCDPSPGYRLIQGSFEQLARLNSMERDFLIDTCKTFHHASATELQSPLPGLLPPRPITTESTALRAGDDYNARGDFREVLKKHGWTFAHEDYENEHWCRPGKTCGTSATINKTGKWLYVFSTNAWPFESMRYYNPYDIYVHLEHVGDYKRAANSLYNEGFGERTAMARSSVNVVELNDVFEPQENIPKNIPSHLLNVPGFVNEFTDYINRTSYAVQPVLALAGALTALGCLTGRRVQDKSRTRTNIYCLGVAESGSGKERAREAIKELMVAAGKPKLVVERIASYQALLKTVATHKTPILLWDEIGRVLGSISRQENYHLSGIPTTLLSLYSSASSRFYGDVRASDSDDKDTSINQPHAVLYGTSVPSSLFKALGEDSLVNGFLGRTLIFEGVNDPVDQDQEYEQVPTRIIETAKWWFAFRPGGNLTDGSTSPNPDPLVIPTDKEAEEVFQVLRDKQKKYRGSDDEIKKSLWSRAVLKAKQLAILYACSADPDNLIIKKDASIWATNLVEYLTERLLILSGAWIADTGFGKAQQEIIRYIRSKHNQIATLAEVQRKFHRMPAKFRHDILSNLEETGIVSRYTELLEGAKTATTNFKFNDFKSAPKSAP